jgi:hypothetical protein
MRSREIQRLVDAVESIHGSVKPYASERTEEHGTCFTIAGVPVTFSVITLEGTLPSGRYDVQIEGSPPGDYLYASAVSLEEFLELVARMSGRKERWPVMNEESS